MLLLGPTVMPWYVIWLVPLAIVARVRAWCYFSGLVCLAFLVMIDGRERAWVLWIEYGTMAMLLGREYLLVKRRPAENPPDATTWSCNERIVTAGEAI
jgi:hypothetical protein